jgi:peptide deformylase
MPEVPEESAQPSSLPTGGAVHPVVRWGDPVMHRKQEPITAFDADLADLVADLVATMYAADGVGLAACQIGVDRAVFVFDCPDDAGVRHQGVVCNPEVYLPQGRDRRLDDGDEGCLSLPGAFVPLARPSYARVVGQGVDGRPVSFAGTGLLARCLQHETDHCDGTVFGDRLNKRWRKRLYKDAEAHAQEFPEGWGAGGGAPPPPPRPTSDTHDPVRPFLHWTSRVSIRATCPRNTRIAARDDRRCMDLRIGSSCP